MKTATPFDIVSYWDKRSTSWIKEMKEEDTPWQFALIEPFLPEYKRVLELGCGTGRFSEYFHDYTGLDFAPTLVRNAVKKHPRKQFWLLDIRDNCLPLGDPLNPFDLYFSHSCFLHLTKDELVAFGKKLPKADKLLFIESNTPSTVDYCFDHDYEAELPVKKVGDLGNGMIVYGRNL